ncbi:MAG: hypothetical protein K2K97_12100 [Muribaculaceae bacterium]|nr:hypothetical protein [Muribaculaceae bacterium]
MPRSLSNPYSNNTQPPLMLLIPQEEWQSLHEKLDRLTDIVEKAPRSISNCDWLESEETRKLLGISPKTWQNYRD